LGLLYKALFCGDDKEYKDTTGLTNKASAIGIVIGNWVYAFAFGQLI